MTLSFPFRFFLAAVVCGLFAIDVAAAQSAPPAQSNELPVRNEAALDAALAEQLSSNETMLTVIRESAENLKPYYRNVFLADDAEQSQRALIDRLSERSHVPDPEELQGLFESLQTRLEALSATSFVRAPVYAPDGRVFEKEVLRIGGFSFIADGHYLVYASEVDKLVELARQPASSLLDLAREFSEADSETLRPVAIDPSGGQVLQLLVQIPNLQERIEQGGLVGYLILALAGFALTLSGYRFVELTLVGKRIGQQLQTSELRLDNPLGRVLSKLEQESSTDDEALYLTVEEALTGEQVKLEHALTFLKLVAAIAPMLGLLGTVTGMIETFQAIALHGSGDPKLMSGGISQALVTTVAGLVTAIPILLIHSLLLGKCQNLGNLLETYVSAALAKRLEQRQSAESGKARRDRASMPLPELS